MSNTPRSHRPRAGTLARLLLTFLFAIFALLLSPHAARAQQGELFARDIFGPSGSQTFGNLVYTLPNGNIVVVDPYYDAGTIPDVGAVYLYDGASLALISRLTGSSRDDRVGGDGIIILANGNFLVPNRRWYNLEVGHAEAITFVNAATGVNGEVSAANSLVGSEAHGFLGGFKVTLLADGDYVVSSYGTGVGDASAAGVVIWGSGVTGVSGPIAVASTLHGDKSDDQVGFGGVIALPSGDYVVVSQFWSAPNAKSAGAVTLARGDGSTVGAVSAANSLVGGTQDDFIGSGGVAVLGNGHFVVCSPGWHAPVEHARGAATWVDGTAGVVGFIPVDKSLYGGAPGDSVCSLGVTPLTDGDYVVSSKEIRIPGGGGYGVEADTWASGDGGTAGPVTAANSLFGSLPSANQDQIRVTALADGDYVVFNQDWRNPDGLFVGAATWGDGDGGTVGTVSVANSLIGRSYDDFEGWGRVMALPNGNYLVVTPSWDGNGAEDAGAVTWGNGDGGTAGVISASISLVGSATRDYVGREVIVLTDGDYVVNSFFWAPPGAPAKGAATWGSGVAGVHGTISTANSLLGTGYDVHNNPASVVALANGNYVVNTPRWEVSAGRVVGAVTWGNGNGGTVGLVSAANSLLGTGGGAIDDVWVTPLVEGDYVASSFFWSVTPEQPTIGAVIWADGDSSRVGMVTEANSLHGGAPFGQVGALGGGVVALPDGDYIVESPSAFIPGEDSNSAARAKGAVTWAMGDGSTVGTMSASNSILNTAHEFEVVNGHPRFMFDPHYQHLVIGRPRAQAVTVAVKGWRLQAAVVGLGTGAISSTPGFIHCGSVCNVGVARQQTVTLTATPAEGSAFVGWGGACTGAGACVVTMTGPKRVTASFRWVAGQATTFMPIAGR